MPTVKTELGSIKDIILAEVLEEQGYCREDGVLAGLAGQTTDVTYGHCLQLDDVGPAAKRYMRVATGSSACCICLSHVTAAENVAGNVNIVVLKRGPAVVVDDALAVHAGTLADAKTALAALLIQTRKAPTQQSQGGHI